MSDSLRPHGLQHARPPCPLLSPRAHSNSCPSSHWCYSTIPSSVVPFPSCPQSFQASGSFLMSQFFTSGGQRSFSVTISPSMIIQGWFLLGLTGLISLYPRYYHESSPTPQFKSISSSMLSLLMVQLSHLYMTTGKILGLTRWTFVGKVTSLLFIMLSRFVIAFLPRKKPVF